MIEEGDPLISDPELFDFNDSVTRQKNFTVEKAVLTRRCSLGIHLRLAAPFGHIIKLV
jgi:hypothetical protein